MSWRKRWLLLVSVTPQLLVMVRSLNSSQLRTTKITLTNISSTLSPPAPTVVPLIVCMLCAIAISLLATRRLVNTWASSTSVAWFAVTMTSPVLLRMLKVRWREPSALSLPVTSIPSSKHTSSPGACLRSSSLARRFAQSVPLTSSSSRSSSIVSRCLTSMSSRRTWCTTLLRLYTVKGWLSPSLDTITTIGGAKLHVANGRGYPLHGLYELYDCGNNYWIIVHAFQPSNFFNA